MLTKEKIKEIQNYIDKNPPKIYWDRDDEVPRELIIEAFYNIKDTKQVLLDRLYNEFAYVDIFTNIEDNYMKEIASKFNISYDDINQFDIYINYNLKELIKKTSDILIRIELSSNIEGYHHSDEYKNSSYIKSLKDIFKEKLLLRQLEEECLNCSSNCNLFTFFLNISLEDLLNIPNNWSKITIPADKITDCGLFSSACGAGGLMECSFTAPITLSKNWNKNCSSDTVEIDIDGCNGYSYEDVYGVYVTTTEDIIFE